MNNAFKVNSRFASLIQEKEGKEGKEENTEINNRKGNKNDNVYGERINNKFKTTDNDRKLKFVEDKKKQQAIIFNDNNFPTLIPTNSKAPTNAKIQPENINFIEKLTSAIVEKEKEKDQEEYILPGWLVMKRDKVTNKIITNYGETTIFKKQQTTYYEIIGKLAFLHDSRTEDYINTWGQDEYEKMFMFPNYDYDYFERLDQEYEEELEELEQLREYELLKYYGDNDYYDD
jgi:hypothetical protein